VNWKIKIQRNLAKSKIAVRYSLRLSAYAEYIEINGTIIIFIFIEIILYYQHYLV